MQTRVARGQYSTECLDGAGRHKGDRGLGEEHRENKSKPFGRQTEDAGIAPATGRARLGRGHWRRVSDGGQSGEIQIDKVPSR